jgi:spore cortex biosynthesis protein YabQ
MLLEVAMVMHTLGLQAQSFAVLCVAGLLIGFLFDMFNMLRSNLHIQHSVLVNVGDLVYWVLAAIVVYVLMFIVNGGEVRLYTLIGVAVGIVVYGRFIRPVSLGVVRETAYILYRFASKLRAIIVRFVTLPKAWLIGFFVYNGHRQLGRASERFRLDLGVYLRNRRKWRL